MCECLGKSDDGGHQKVDGNDGHEHQDKRSGAGQEIGEGRNHDANDDQVQTKSDVSCQKCDTGENLYWWNEDEDNRIQC